MSDIKLNLKQEEFLSTDADIALMGGGVGSGKTLGIVLDLLRLNEYPQPAIFNPNYNALICRRHYRDLRDLVHKQKIIYPMVDAKAFYHQGDQVWKFSSGARIQNAYFDTLDRCVSMCQGAEYQTIAIDEAMHFPTSEIFLYLMSRLRNTFGMRCYARLTSNPGKYPWLRKYFRINDYGDSTDFSKEFTLDNGTVVTKRIKYIQAKLSDNPHLPPEYAATLMMMSEEDKLALLDGMWNAYDSVEGQVYELELKRMRKENRICRLQLDRASLVHTFWDIGISDSTVILFVQFIGKEIRIIHEIRGNNKSIKDDYIPAIQAWGEDNKARFATHWLPHDARAREKFAGLSILDQVQEYFPNAETTALLPLADGLQLAKAGFCNVLINSALEVQAEDEDAAIPDNIITDLTKYKRVWDTRLECWTVPLHNAHSHGADAFRYIFYYQPVDNIDISQFQPQRIESTTNPFAIQR
jgi:hypothetical protein